MLTRVNFAGGRQAAVAPAAATAADRPSSGPVSRGRSSQCLLSSSCSYLDLGGQDDRQVEGEGRSSDGSASVPAGVGTVELHYELGGGVDDRRSVRVTGFGVDVAVDGKPGGDAVEVAKRGFEAGEHGQGGQEGGLLGVLEGHFGGYLAEGPGWRAVRVEGAVAGNESLVAVGPHRGKRDSTPLGRAAGAGRVKPSVWSRDSIITFMSLLDATEESWSALLA